MQRDEFLYQLKHNVEVFSAFRTHRMQNDIAARLTDDEGKLRTFSQFRKAVEGYTDHQNRAWLRTEYDTAIRRAHQAADCPQCQKQDSEREDEVEMPGADFGRDVARNVCTTINDCFLFI